MSSNQVLHNDTALAEDTIISSLTSEVKRRMFNTSEQLDMKERITSEVKRRMFNTSEQLDMKERITSEVKRRMFNTSEHQ
jgi:hypothetical protein